VLYSRKVKRVGYLARYTLLVFLISLFTVFLQLYIYGAYLWDLSVAQIAVIFCIMLAAGLLTTIFARWLCRLIFFPSSSLPAWVSSFLARQADVLSMITPEILLSRTAGINAFAISDLLHHGILVVQQEIFTQLTQDEIEAVLAHELSHLKLRHAVVLTVLQGMCIVPLLPLILLATALIALIYDTKIYRSIFLTLQSVFILIIFPLPGIFIATITRYWEYSADKMAATIVGKEKYIAALRCLHGSFFQHPNLLSATTLTKTRISKEGWALSHPGLMQRINALRDDG